MKNNLNKIASIITGVAGAIQMFVQTIPAWNVSFAGTTVSEFTAALIGVMSLYFGGNSAKKLIDAKTLKNQLEDN